MTAEAFMNIIHGMSVNERKRLINLIIDTLTQESNPGKIFDIREFRGAGAGIAEGVKAIELVNEMRDEWDKPSEN